MKKEKKQEKKEKVGKLKKGVHEFRDFINRGNVVDMAVGVIIGSAFGKIVSSLVNDILMPFIGLLMGGLNVSGLKFTFHKVVITYGAFIQSIIDFLIIAFCVFMIVKIMSKFKHPKEIKEEVAVKSDEVLLLEEIRDLLKQGKKQK